jgi:hypothetical protein
MKHPGIAKSVACAMVAALCVAAGSAPRAEKRGAPSLTHFVGRAPLGGERGEGSRIDIIIERWSSDAERDEMRAAFTTKGAASLLATLRGIGRPAGVMLIPGVPAAGARARLRHPINLYFARQLETAKGRQIVAATDHYLALDEPTVKWPSEVEFSLLDIRFAADGTGVGKVAAGAELAYNAKTRTIEVGDYEARPARLIEVRPAPAVATGLK